MARTGRPPQPILDRIRRLAPPHPSGCRLWVGPLTRDGYAKFQVGGRTRLAHRVAYELENGPIPPGKQLDHRCHNPELCPGGRTCPHRRYVEVLHLEPVTPKVNTNRGRRANSEKTVCPKGHSYNKANTYWRPLRDGRPGRSCRACHREAERSRKTKKRVAA